MKKFIVASALALSLLVPGVAFAALTETQIAAVLGLLRAFNADASALYDVEASLRGEVLGATVACPALTMTLQRGMSDATTGGQVTKLQAFLATYYGLNPQDSVTGYFGSVTQRNVIRFQTEQGLSPVGVVGVLTRAKIASVCSGGSVSTTSQVLKPGPICPAIAYIPVECAVGAPSPRYDANGCQTGWQCTATSTAAMLNVSLDASSPAYALVAAGTKDVPLAAYRFTATGQSVTLQKVRLALASGPTPQAVPTDLEKVTLWNGTTKVGEGFFLGNSYGTVVTLTQSMYIQAGTSLVLTIKGDIAPIGIAEPVSVSGHLVQVGVDTGFSDTTGQSLTGTTVIAGGAPGFPAGVRIMKSLPVVSDASGTLTPGGLTDGRLMRFKVSADSRGTVGLTQLYVVVSPTGAQVKNVNIYGYEDAGFSTPISGVSPSGALRATDACPAGCASNTPVNIGITTSVGTLTAIQIPAGTSRYFEVRATVTGVQSGASVTTKLMGDGAYSTPVSAVSMVGKDAYFIWSPNSTSTAVRADQDWFTGYGVSGLPSTGISYTRTGSVTTPMPLPAITGYTASPTAISVGQSATLMWSTTGTTDGGCHIYLGASGTNVNTAGLPGSGSFTVTPSVTTAYRLWCTNSWKDGSQNVERTVTVTVQNPTAPKPVACPLMIYTPVSCTGTTLPKYDANGCLTGVMCQEKPVTEGIFVPGSENAPFQQ